MTSAEPSLIVAFETAVASKLPGNTLTWSTFQGQHRLTIQPKKSLEILRTLRDGFGMDMLIDVTAVDYLEYPGAKDRFEVVYCLLNTESGQRLIVTTFLNEPDLRLDSVYSLWTSADWLEREVYDMFGIVFDGHPNFKRLLLPDEFASFPLRKDYPLKGRGERHNFPVVTRSES